MTSDSWSGSATITRPPDRVTRIISCTLAIGSGRCCTTRSARTAPNVEGPNGSWAASPIRARPPRSIARRAMAAERSIPTPAPELDEVVTGSAAHVQHRLPVVQQRVRVLLVRPHLRPRVDAVLPVDRAAHVRTGVHVRVRVRHARIVARAGAGVGRTGAGRAPGVRPPAAVRPRSRGAPRAASRSRRRCRLVGVAGEGVTAVGQHGRGGEVGPEFLHECLPEDHTSVVTPGCFR